MSRGQLARQIELLAQHLRETPRPSESAVRAYNVACAEWDRQSAARKAAGP